MTLSRSMGSRFDGTLGAQPLDTRLTFAALLAPGGSGLAARPGVFPGAPAALVAGSATGWNYQITAPAGYATTRGASDGAHIVTGDGPQLVPTEAAPGTAGASRIDIVYVLQPSKGENLDGSSTPVFAVAKGQATTGTPVPPALPPGALELARNTITAGATSTASTGNAIVQTWRYTALRGAPILVRNKAERDELTALASAAFPIVADRLDTGALERNAGAGWSEIAGAATAGFTPNPAAFQVDPSIRSSLTKSGGRWHLLAGVNNKGAGDFTAGWNSLGTIDAAARTGDRVVRTLATVVGGPWGYALPVDIYTAASSGAVMILLPSTANIPSPVALTIAVSAQWDA